MSRKNTDPSPAPAKPPRGKPAPRRVLNLPLLLGTIVAGLALPIAAYGWHAFQLGRIAEAFIARATVLEEEENWREAASYVYRYVELCPEYSEERVRAQLRLARDYDRSAATSDAKIRAIELYYEALGVAPEDEQTGIRHRLSELLLELGRFLQAENESLQLIAADDQDAKAHRMLALALYGQFQSGELAARHGIHLAEGAAFQLEGLPEETRQRMTIVPLAEGDAFQVAALGDAFEIAVAVNPQDVGLAAAWARVLRNEPDLLSDNQRRELTAQAEREKKSEKEIRERDADQVVDRMVSDDPESADAYVARYVYRDRHGLAGAEDDLRSALTFEPENVTVLLVAGGHYQRKAERARDDSAPAGEVDGLYDDAAEHYADAIDHGDPPKVAAYVGLGDAYSAQGKREEAIRVWQQGLDRLGQLDVTLNAQLVGGLIAMGRLAEAEQALRRLDDGKSRLEARLNENTRLKWDRARDLLEAELLLRKGKPLASLPLARPVTASGLSEAGERLRAWLLLGDGFSSLGHWDQAAAAYENAVGLDPKLVTMRVAAATAWLKADQPQKAIGQLEQVPARSTSLPVQLQLARALLAYQVTLPAQRRDWPLFDRALSNVTNADYRNVLSEPWRVELLEADYAMVRANEQQQPQDGFGQALAPLRKAEQDYADVVPFWRELVLRYERMEQTGDADRALARCQAMAEEAAATYLLASRIYTGRKQFERARQVLRDGLSSLSGEQRFALRFDLAQVSIVEGKLDQAKAELDQLERADPSNLPVLLQLAELALDTDDVSGVEQWERRLEDAEGSDGTLWRYVQARRLLGTARPTADPAVRKAVFDQVEGLLANIRSRRPSWSAGYLLAGSLEERRGQLDLAAEAYQRAIRLGEQRVSVYERLTLLLYTLRRFAEADEYLRLLGNRIPSSETLSPLAIGVAAGQQDLTRAETVAKQALDSRPADPMAWIWYGQVLLLNKQQEPADAAFRKAVELAPTDVNSWNGLFSFQLRTGQRDEARETLSELAKQAELTDTQRAFVLAQGYELLGDSDLAEAKYREAAGTEAGRDSIAIHGRMAAFYLRRDNPQAEAALRRVMALAQQREDTRGTADSARRSLAGLLAARGGDADLDEAMRLLQQTGADRRVADLDKRLQAVLLTQGSDPDLGRAQQLLEELVYDVKTDADGDRLLLAWVYIQQGQAVAGEAKQAKQQAAREQYESLCMRSQPRPPHLALFVTFLMRQEDWGDADRSLRRLEEIAPDYMQTTYLRARWLRRQDRGAEIEPIVESWAQRLEGKAEDDQQRLQVYGSVGDMYLAYDLHSAAETWYRKAVALDPERYPALAQSLASQSKTTEAVRLCVDRAKDADSPWPATVLATVLTAGRAGDEHLRVAEPLLAKASDDFPSDPGLLLAMANLRVVQRRIDEAIGLYEDVLRLRPNNVVAMNNLATLLSEKSGKVNEALRYIDQAIAVAGRKAAFLDTKGMALVHGGRVAEAIGILREATGARDADPRYDFHLAVALERVGDAAEARAAFATAVNNDLNRQLLTETDQRLLEELERLFGEE